MNKADRAIENIHNLYVMQFQLLDLLESDLRDAERRKEVKKTMKEFEALLSKADWRYMGGMEVWESLKNLPVEMSKKLRESSVNTAKSRAGTKKAIKAKVTKAIKSARKLEKAGRFGKKK